jgi:molybdopterin converting factor small subunit
MSEKPPAGHFRILYFASAASFTRKSSDDFSAPLPIADLFGVIDRKYPGIRAAVLLSAAVTVNLDYVDIEEDGETSEDIKGILINGGDEVAIIPPVSSG